MAEERPETNDELEEEARNAPETEAELQDPLTQTEENDSGEGAEGEDSDQKLAVEPEKSPEEIAAEEAMLAALAEDDSSDGDAEGPVDEASELVLNPASIPQNLEILIDVSLDLTVELGRRSMKFGEVLALGKGSLVELNKIADEPVDIYVNQSKIAEGEVVVVDDHFGVRITRLLSKESFQRAT